MRLGFAGLAAFAAVAMVISIPVAAQVQAPETQGAFVLPVPPSPGPGQVVTLEEAVRQADSTNRSLAAIREDINIAAAKLQASWSGLMPTLYGSVGYSFNEAATTTGSSGQTVAASQNQLNAGLSLKVPLIEAREWIQISSAQLETEVTQLQVEQSRQVLLYSVAEAYFQASTALSLITVYTSQYDALKEHLELAEARLAAGVGDIMDVTSARTDLVSSWIEIVKAGYSLADARDALAILMGVDGQPMPVVNPVEAGSSDTVVSSEMLGAMTAPDSNAADNGNDSPDNRWDLQVLDRQASLLRSELKAGYMPFAPSLSGFFNYNVDILGNDAIQNYDRDSWSLGLSLSIPIFDYSFIPGLSQSRAGIVQAELQMDQARAEGTLAIHEARRNVQKLASMMAAQKVKVVLADQLLSLAEADFANGTGLAIAVTDARRTALSAHVDLATAAWEYELGVLNLNRQLGVDIMKSFERR